VGGELESRQPIHRRQIGSRQRSDVADDLPVRALVAQPQELLAERRRLIGGDLSGDHQHRRPLPGSRR
jgi:hypothetical protein